MARKQRDTSKKRRSIIDAAIRAFQEDGYDNTSMDRIAEVAGASKRTVYNHFPSKEALFESVIEHSLNEASALKAIPYDPEVGLEFQLTEFAHAKVRLLRDPAWMGLMKVGLGVFVRDPELARRTMAQAEEGEDHLAIWLEAATEDGQLKVKDPAQAARVFWAMVSGAIFWPQALQGPMDPELVQTIIEELVRVFLAGYASGGAA
jgi:TetR/AcrR family transcriptional regulator of autoinduction and epiphytic fitness